MSVGLTLNGGTLVAQNRDERRDTEGRGVASVKCTLLGGCWEEKAMYEGWVVMWDVM
jgi:hypothetical protein